LKIKEFLISRYGPVAYDKKVLLESFNLFFGMNEQGKTLTIDALVKMLLGRGVKDFEDIERVKEKPEGYVIIEKGGGNQVKLPHKGFLGEVAGITPSECRNIFIIRNSDLSIQEQGEFFTDITDHLTGLRVEEIKKIKDSLLKIAFVTPTWIFRDIREDRLKSRIEEAKKLIEKIEDILSQMENENYDELLERIVFLREEIDFLENRVQKLEQARSREKYEQGRKALKSMKEAIEEVSRLEKYTQDELRLWEDNEAEIKRISEERGKLLLVVHENKNKRERLALEKEKAQDELTMFNSQKVVIENEIKPRVKESEKVTADLQGKRVRVRFWSLVGIISSALLAISMLGVIIDSFFFFAPLTILFFSLSCFALIIRLQEVNKRVKLEKEIKKIDLLLSKYELGGKSLQEIIQNLEKFENIFKRQTDEINRLSRDMGIEEEMLKKREEDLRNFDLKISQDLSGIENIRKNSGISTLEEYREIVEKKEKLREEINTQKHLLQNLFPGEPQEPESKISYWQSQIEELEEYRGLVHEISFSEKELQELKIKISTYRNEIAIEEQKMGRFEQALGSIEKDVNSILNLQEDYIHCKTSRDLEGAKKELEQFIKKYEKQRDNVKEVFTIFEEIETEERAKVAGLFGSDSPVSSYFGEVTMGKYMNVFYDQIESRISVIRSDGEKLESEKLSSGTFDQLYLCIRLALGEKLLGGEKGFFIMDDPFIKSDKERLARQLALLLKITEWGWQVLYFTAKEEVVTFFDTYMKNRIIKYFQLPGIAGKN